MRPPLLITEVYRLLINHYGPQHWWPADSPFEVMVGAVLTQNTAWTNVERAIHNLKQSGLLSPERIVAVTQDELAAQLIPSGYFNIKARRLVNLCRWMQDAGGLAALQLLDDRTLRQRLLTVNGVGPETADDILLYAFDRPLFVIDAYTRRLFTRLALIAGDESYETLRQRFESAFIGADGQVATFNEYHALIVIHAKGSCRKRPLCAECCLAAHCPTAP